MYSTSRTLGTREPNGKKPGPLDPAKLSWVEGTVTRGSARGKEIGFPTANLSFKDDYVRPREGIYACWVRLDLLGDIMPAVMHVGPRPTFDDMEITVEIHILDFNKDLYDQTIEFATVQSIRGVKKFDTIEELQRAIQRDCDEARKILSNP
ncbi:MAG: riboflavin kinase [Candidatus Andersenbacteria bacterium]